MNEKQAKATSEIIFERVVTESVDSVNPVHTGIKMKTQIPFASKIGLSGVAASTSTCERQASGAGLTSSEKQWEPKGIEDVFKRQFFSNGNVQALYGQN